MYPSIVEKHSVQGLDLKAIVKRIIKHLPSEVLKGLNEITLYNKHDEYFARYIRDEGRIELFVEDIVGWQPWLLKRTYFFPYLCVGIELGGAIEQHVNRENVSPDEEFIPQNPLKYVYPSLGIFKYALKMIFCVHKTYSKIRKRPKANRCGG